jgi:hypothetical protein
MKPIIQTQFPIYSEFVIGHAISADLELALRSVRALGMTFTWNIVVPLANQIRIPLPGF